jgi:nucleotide-binding universal stress UspA family protein
MLRSALVPLDDSSSTEFAVQQAIAFSHCSSFQLMGLGIVDVAEIGKPEMTGPGSDAYKEERDEALLRDANTRVEECIERFQATCEKEQVSYQTRIAGGDPYQEVVDEAERHDIIFVGRNSNFHFETRDEVGETFRQLAQDAPRPVMAAPEAEAPCEDNVVVGYDGSNQAARALQMFSLLLLSQIPKIHVITVDKHKAHAESRCRRAAQFLENRGADVSAYPIESDTRPSEILLAQLEILKPRCCILGSYGRTGISRFFFGSTTRDLLRECQRSIFIYH